MSAKPREFINEIKPQSKLGRIFGGGNGQYGDMVVARLERAEQLMTDLSARTGGQIYSPLKEEEMKDVYGQVARELKNQYIITYVSKNEDRNGQLRHIKVYLTRPGYTARTRDGYYAPKK